MYYELSDGGKDANRVHGSRGGKVEPRNYEFAPTLTLQALKQAWHYNARVSRTTRHSE
jgi:hypothetical protein